MPLSQSGPSELEPFLSIYDQLRGYKERAEVPRYTRRLEQAFGAPIQAGGYTYGRQIGAREKALQDVGMQIAGSRSLGAAQDELKKDMARRTYLQNRAATAQQIENFRGRSAKALGKGLTTGVGDLTAPIRPGGKYYGALKDRFERDATRARETLDLVGTQLREQAERRSEAAREEPLPMIPWELPWNVAPEPPGELHSSVEYPWGEPPSETITLPGDVNHEYRKVGGQWSWRKRGGGGEWTPADFRGESLWALEARL